MYDRTLELKKKGFAINSQNIKEAISIQVPFMLEIKLKKVHFLANYDHFFSRSCLLFEALLGWECACVCHDLRTEKEEIYIKKREYYRCNWHTSDLYL